uniref:PH domain-containing protein n=1 Tax=Streptomyces sp. NBC_00049 TaxID=2903617 RepID=A0AAU2JRJ0_9ACTN
MNSGRTGPPDGGAVRDALGDWRRDGLLLCLLPVFCWPAVLAAALARPAVTVASLAVLLSPVAFGVRELRAVRRVRRALRDPGVRWTSYEAVVVRSRWRPPVLVLDGGEGRRRHVLTLGLLGRRALPPQRWARTAGAGEGAGGEGAGGQEVGGEVGAASAPADTVVLRMAGEPSEGGVVWMPEARRLGFARSV